MKLNTKKTLAALTAFVLAATTMTTTAPPAFAATFTDVPTNHWANTAISRAADAGIMTGIGNNQFAPSKTLTKAEFATILARAFYGDEYNQALKTETETWYAAAEYVIWKHEISAYTDNGTLDMESRISRYDMAGMMYGVLLDKGIALPTDAELNAAKAKIPDWNKVEQHYDYDADFTKYVSVCYAMGLLTGTGSGAFNGDAYTDRASTATIYGRLADKLGIGGTYTPPKEETPPAQPQPETPPATDTSTVPDQVGSVTLTADEKELIRLVQAKQLENQEIFHAADYQYYPYTHSEPDEILMKAARIRAKELAVSFSHTRPNGERASTVLQEAGLPYEGSMGEICTMEVSSPAHAIQAFMNSPQHKAIMLSGHKNMGAALYQENGVNYCAIVFL